MTGSRAPIDYKVGVDWLFRAALAGNARAQRDIAIAYLRGEGVMQSETTAFEWYWQAAEHGDEASQIRLCSWYQEGKGIETDLVIAEAWCLIAPNTASSGTSAASFSLNQRMTEEQQLEGKLLTNLWKNSTGPFIPLHSKWFAEHTSNANKLQKENASVKANATRASSCEANHWIQSVAEDGAVIKLEDGSIWKVSDTDTLDSALWLATDDVIVCDGKLIKTDDSESVEARRLR